MAIVTKYFSTAANGAGDGSSWNDRAVLFTAGAWSTAITGFDFSGSDSLECLVEGGLTYTITVALVVGLFTNAPSAANPIIFHGCDSSGNRLDPPDPDWVSAQPPFSTATFPVLATTSSTYVTGITTASLWRCICFTASAYANATCFYGSYDWCSITNSTSNTSARGIDAPSNITNSWIAMTGSSFDFGVRNPVGMISNVRIDGSAGTSSGTRRGIQITAGGYNVSRSTVIGCAGGAALAATGTATRLSWYSQCSFINNGSYGIQCNGTASQTVYHAIHNCYFSGNTYGIDANGSRTVATSNRLRDSTSGNFVNFGNYPTDYNYTTDSDDATEFVDSGAGDYRIKNTATIWGKGYGAGDEPASGGGMIGSGNLSGGLQ